MIISKFFKKKNREPLVKEQIYDSPACKTPQEMPFACVETAWTTCSYSLKRLKQYMDSRFEIEARKAAQNVDSDIPWYMDQRIINMVNDAIHDLERQKASRSESIDEIIHKKQNTVCELTKELGELKAERIRLQKIIEETGGYDYV